jgi:hypothetical protein
VVEKEVRGGRVSVPDPLRILAVADHPLVRGGIAALIAGVADMMQKRQAIRRNFPIIGDGRTRWGIRPEIITAEEDAIARACLPREWTNFLGRLDGQPNAPCSWSACGHAVDESFQRAWIAQPCQ